MQSEDIKRLIFWADFRTQIVLIFQMFLWGFFWKWLSLLVYDLHAFSLQCLGFLSKHLENLQVYVA